MSSVPAKYRISVADYLAREERALTRSEFYDGEIVAMAGATIPHNIITTNVLSHLHALLRGSGCRPFGSDLRIKVNAANSFLYPDVTVVCGDIVQANEDACSATNPRVVIEVLSDSTESKDRGRKFQLYLKLDSLQEYVLISQHQPRIERLFRRNDATWIMSIAEGLKDWVVFDSIDCRLAMAEIYDGVKFEQTRDETN